MQHIFKHPKEYSFQAVGIKGKTFETRELNGKVEFSVIETEMGHETMIREKECDFNYYILEGKGNFEINGNIEECQKGDMVIIPSGSILSIPAR